MFQYLYSYWVKNIVDSLAFYWILYPSTIVYAMYKKFSSSHDGRYIRKKCSSRSFAPNLKILLLEMYLFKFAFSTWLFYFEEVLKFVYRLSVLWLTQCSLFHNIEQHLFAWTVNWKEYRLSYYYPLLHIEYLRWIEIYRCPHWRGEWSVLVDSGLVRGLWSLIYTKSRPSTKWRKWFIDWLMDNDSLSNVEYFRFTFCSSES